MTPTEHAALSPLLLKMQGQAIRSHPKGLYAARGLVATVDLGVALSFVPVVEGKLSPDLAICVVLVDFSVIPILFWVFIPSLFCGFLKSGLYCEIL